MADQEWFDEWIDEKLGRFASDLGLSEETMPEDLTRELGQRFGAKLKDLLPVEEEVYDAFVETALKNFAEIFPLAPDEDIFAMQAIFLAPVASVALTGRGLSVPELADVAGIDSPQLYRAMRKGLNILYKPADAKPRTGVHRDQSGVDYRKARVTVDYENMLGKEWPEPISGFQPFLLGILDGVKSCLSDPWVRSQVEAGFKAAIAKGLRDPILGDIFEGSIEAAQRIIQRMTDSGLLLTRAEQRRADNAGRFLAEIAHRKREFLDALQAAASEIGKSIGRPKYPALTSGSVGP